MGWTDMILDAKFTEARVEGVEKETFVHTSFL